MAGIVEHQAQRHAFLGAEGVQGPAGLAAVYAAHHQAVDDHLGAHQLVERVDQAPGALVPDHGQFVGGEVEADAAPTPARHEEAVYVAVEDGLQPAPDPPAFIHVPARDAGQHRDGQADHEQQQQEPGEIVHGGKLSPESPETKRD